MHYDQIIIKWNTAAPKNISLFIHLNNIHLNAVKSFCTKQNMKKKFHKKIFLSFEDRNNNKLFKTNLKYNLYNSDENF